MCLNLSSQHNTQTQRFELTNVDKLSWLENIINTPAAFQNDKTKNPISEICKSITGLSKYGMVFQRQLNKNEDDSDSNDHACDKEIEITSVIHHSSERKFLRQENIVDRDTYYDEDEEHKFDRLQEELLKTKCEIQYNISQYRSYIKELSSYILYTNVMIVLLHFMIIAILISHPNCFYLYLYLPLPYL